MKMISIEEWARREEKMQDAIKFRDYHSECLVDIYDLGSKIKSNHLNTLDKKMHLIVENY